jgi:hypothetical protein
MLFECNDEISAYEAAEKETKEKEDKEKARRTVRQEELKEETMQTLSQRSARKRALSASRGSGSVEELAAAAVDLTDEKESDAVNDSESSVPPEHKRRRTDVRSLMKESMDLSRSHFAAHQAALEEQLTMQRQQLAAVNEYNNTVDKRMGESNTLFAQLIAKM